MTSEKNVYLLYLEYPERCFHADAGLVATLRGMVPKGSRIVRAKSDAEFLKALPAATHAIVWRFEREWFARASKLRLLATPSAGRELVAQDGPKGLTIHFGSYHGRIISESVLGFILAWAHGFFLPEIVERGKRGRSYWPRTEISGRCRQVSGTKAVLFGYGNLGRRIGAKLESVGIRVEGFGRHNLAQMPRAMKDADWFVMSVPSDPATDDYLNAAMLGRLPRRCVVINVGRGNSVDEEALVAALKSGRIAGAWLDVVKREGEVCAGTYRPKIVRGVPNLVVTPHSAVMAPEYLRYCLEQLDEEGLLR